jgi:isopentenyldiphosphate isomerase
LQKALDWIIFQPARNPWSHRREGSSFGAQRRGISHAQGLIHRLAHVLPFNSSGELFLQKRTINKDGFAGLRDNSAAGPGAV